MSDEIKQQGQSTDPFGNTEPSAAPNAAPTVEPEFAAMNESEIPWVAVPLAEEGSPAEAPQVAVPLATENVPNEAPQVDMPLAAEAAAEETPAGGAHQAPKRNKYADKMNKKSGKRNKKIGLVIGIIVALLLIAAAVALVILTRKPPEDISAQTAVVTRGMLETYIEGEGVTAANKREEVGKEAKGKVQRVMVEVGDEVSAGDELMVIDPTETREELKTAQEELATAKQAVTDAQTEVTQAQTLVTAAQNNLGKLTITAPFTGRMIPVGEGEDATSEYKVGQQISDGQTIGYMVDDGTMRLALYFSTAYKGEIKSGQTATVSIPSSMSTVSGTVASIESAEKVSDEGVRMFRVIITMKNPGTLTKGMTASATVSTSSGEVFPVDSDTLQYAREEAVTATVGGEITSVGGIDYYSYNSGATIMRLTSDAAQNELKNAQTQVNAARTQVTNAQKVVTEKQKRVTELTTAIADSTIKAPIDGVIVSLNAVPDMDVSGGSALAVIADMDDIIVNANIASTDVLNVEAGQIATMSMYTQDGEISMTGTVESVALEPSQDAGGQGSMPTFAAVISIDPTENPLSIGQYVNFKITTASSMDCLIVPSSAVVYTEEGTAVFAKLPDENDQNQNDGGMMGDADMGSEMDPGVDDSFDAVPFDETDPEAADEGLTDDAADDDYWVAGFDTGDGAADDFSNFDDSGMDGSSDFGGGLDENFSFANTLPIPEGANVPEGFVLVPVEIGISDSTSTEILWGLKEGVIVYLAGPTDMYADMNDGGGMTVAVG